MKSFLQNLLVFLSLGLCALCAWQWLVQTRLHSQGEALQQSIFKQTAEIQDDTNLIKNMDAEISSLSVRVKELAQSATSNELLTLDQKREITRLRDSGQALSNEVSQYKDIVDKLEAKLKEAADGIDKQNDAFKKLLAQRDDAIQRYNDSVKDRNDIVEKYNALVAQVKKLQAPQDGKN